VEGNTGKEGENTNVKMSEVAEIGVGIATAKAKVLIELNSKSSLL